MGGAGSDNKPPQRQVEGPIFGENHKVRTALYCYSVIMVVLGCIPFIKWEEMVVEGG